LGSVRRRSSRLPQHVDGHFNSVQNR
jgi:hypothetical protein